MLFRVLGPVSVLEDDGEIDLGGLKQRSLLALLLVHRNETVPLERLIDLLWGERPPDTAAKTIQVYVSRLRRSLGEGRIETRGRGYALVVEDGELDLDRFQALVERARREDPAEAASTLQEAVSLYRGDPLQDLAYEPWSSGEIDRLSELRLAAQEQLIDAELQLGRHAQLVPELESRVGAHPLRERLRGQLMLALYRSGRHAEALDAYRHGRALLDEQLGLEPGLELRQLEQRILQHDESLAPPDLPLAAEIRRRRGLQLVVAGAVILLAAAIAAVVVVATRSGGRDFAAPPNSLVALDARNGRVIGATPVGDTPSDVAYGEGAVWVLSANENALDRVDPLSRTVTKTIPIDGSPSEVVVAGGSVWVATRPEDGKGVVMVRVDPASNVVADRVEIPLVRRSPPFSIPPPVFLVTDGVSIWIDTYSTLARMEARSGRLKLRRFARFFGPLARGSGSIWIGGVARIDPPTGREIALIPLDSIALDATAGGGAVWAADGTPNQATDVVWRIEPRTNSLGRTVSVGSGVSGLAYAEGSLWVASRNGEVSRVDTSTNRVVETITIGGTPRNVVVGGGKVWVTVD